MDKNCIFCKIINKEMKAEFVYEDEDIVAIKDINPQAPVHILIIPKKHISTLNDITEEDDILIGKMHRVAKELAESFNISKDGYRVVFNCGPLAGQSVYHIHLHLLGGRPFRWPPG